MHRLAAKWMDTIVQGITDMTPKQLKSISHLLAPIPDIMEDISLANKLPRSNQARKRQEGLIAKKIRSLVDDRALEKLEVGPPPTLRRSVPRLQVLSATMPTCLSHTCRLQEAVKLAESTESLYYDSDISSMVSVWQEGLLQGDEVRESEGEDEREDGGACVLHVAGIYECERVHVHMRSAVAHLIFVQEVREEVLARAAAHKIEVTHQDLTQMVRQIRQCAQEEEETAQREEQAIAALAAAAGASASTDGEEPSASVSLPSVAVAEAVAGPRGELAQPDTSMVGGREMSRSVTEDPELLALLVKRGGFKPSKGRLTKGGGQVAKTESPTAASDRAQRRRATQLAVNALTKVLSRVAEQDVFGKSR
jgi:hypothetical protein